jgi:hypothetical protein
VAATVRGPDRVRGHGSGLTYDLEPVGDTVKLTVTHEDLPADQLDGTTNGWERVLSSLKSLLETGQGLRSIL